MNPMNTSPSGLRTRTLRTLTWSRCAPPPRSVSWSPPRWTATGGGAPVDTNRLLRSKSREPSPFTMPPMRLSCGTTTPGGGSVADPHAYFSRPGSSQSLHGGRGGATDKKEQEFRWATSPPHKISMLVVQVQDGGDARRRRLAAHGPQVGAAQGRDGLQVWTGRRGLSG
jgi:hypothetical protein